MIQDDEERLGLFSNFLSSYNFDNITRTSQFCRWDIESTYKNTKCLFEVKYRPTNHDNYFNDTIIEYDKYLALKQQPHKVYVVNIFNDGYLTVIPLEAEHELQEKYCQKTNNWDRTKVKKTLVSYPNLDKYLYNYTYFTPKKS